MLKKEQNFLAVNDIRKLLLYAILIQLPLLIFHITGHSNRVGGSDLEMYILRSKSILSGNLLVMPGMPPSDFIPGFAAPPLINYFFLPAAIFDFKPWSFEVLFSLANCVNVYLLYLICIAWKLNKKRALQVGLLYILNPFFWLSSNFIVSDEPIVVLVLLLPFVFLPSKPKVAIVLCLVAFLVKFWMILLLPVVLAYIKSNFRWSLRKILVVFISSAFLLISPFILSFYLEYGIEGFAFPKHVNTNELHGISLWRILSMNLELITPSAQLKVSLLFANVIAIGWLAYLVIKSRISIFKAVITVLLSFLLLSFKVYIEYYVLVVPFLILFLTFESGNHNNAKFFWINLKFTILMSIIMLWGNFSFWVLSFGIEMYLGVLLLLIRVWTPSVLKFGNTEESQIGI